MYITIAPSKSRGGRWLVAMRGLNHRYYVIAECPSQVHAEDIAEALTEHAASRSPARSSERGRQRAA